VPDVVVVTESGIVTVSQGETLVTVFDGRGFKGDPGDSFDQTLNTTDAVEFAGLVNNGLTFPTVDGTAGQVIETDGAGVLSFVTPSGGDFLPLAGGAMTGSITSLGASHDTEMAGEFFGVQLSADHTQGTMVNFDGLDTYDGANHMFVNPTGLTFPDTTVQTTAYIGGAGVSSLTAGTGISLDVTTGDITVTNDDPDQTVVLTNGTGITVTGTYPSFTIDCDITQYTDTDARLSLSAGTGISYDNATGIITNDEPDQTVSLTGGTDISVTGTYPDFTIDFDGSTSYLPLSGGTLTGNIVFDGTSGQYIGKGTFDTSRSGNYGISIVCSVGYEFNWQAGWLVTTEQASATPRPLYLDSLAGTTLRAWDSSKSTGTEVDHLGITFADSTVQTTAYTGGAGVSSLTAGTGISLDVTTGDITVTNSEPDQTVTLTNGTGITITGTYPSFTIDCDITQYTDTDARLALSAGTGISYDDSTGIITNDEPDQTVTLTNGTGITITGTYPSFTIDCDITQYTDTDARLSLSAGTGISYDDSTGIITNDEPDQTVTLTNGADITITGTYPSFTIAYSGTAGSGTVTTASVVSANGFAGTVATDTTTPAITISTSITGLLKGDGTAISAATSGTDYIAPSGALGTPSSGTLTSCTGLPISTGVSGLGTSVATFLATPSSANLAAALTDGTGTGANVFATSPTLVTPLLGTPTSGVMTNVTGTASGLTAGNVTTNANLTGHITSTGNAAVLGSFTSAQLLAALTDETGSGLAVFATSPTLTTPTITGLKETKTAPTIASGVLALNCASGNVFHVSLNAAITSITFSNIPTTGTAYGLTLAFTADGTARAVTWPAAVKWSGGTAPTLTSTNAKVDIFVLTTWDGGTSWYSMIGGQNF